MGIRAREHTRHATGKTAISDHIRSCDFCQCQSLDFNNFSILSKCSDKFDCVIREALLIKNSNPPLNKQLYNSGSTFVLKLF